MTHNTFQWAGQPLKLPIPLGDLYPSGTCFRPTDHPKKRHLQNDSVVLPCSRTWPTDRHTNRQIILRHWLVCVISLSLSLFIRGSKLGFSRIPYWIHLFTARFGGVHAFGYNSAESEPIWRKSGALWVHCRDWPSQILGAIRAVATAGEPGEILFLSGKQRTISRRPNFTKFEHNTQIGVAIKTIGT